MKNILLVFATLFALCTSALADGPGWPNRPITLVVPYAAGGPMDKLARELSEPLKVSLGVPVLVQNVPGAGGTVGTAQVKRAANDGYTFLMNHIGMATAPALYKDLSFDAVTDFETLGVFADVPLVLVVRPDIPTKSVSEFIRWAALSPTVKIANAGVGSASHLCGLLIQASIRVPMTNVPYRGTSLALTDLLGGHVDMLCDLTSNALPQILAGKVKAVGVTSRDPLYGSELKDVPTLKDFGIDNVQLSIWYGLYSPKGLDVSIQNRLNAEIRKVMCSPDFQKAQTSSGIRIPRASDPRTTPAGHREHLIKQIDHWSSIIKTANVEASK